MYQCESNTIEERELSDTNSDICQIDGNVSLDNSEIEANNINNITITRKSNNKTFRIIEANVNSLKGKKEELKALIETEKPDCLILIETKLNHSHQNISM